MLHCHIGSQIYDIRTIKYAVNELTHLYVELVKLGAPMGILDLGGGLGIDYDGTQSATQSSVNYTLEQYAADIVHRVKFICDDAGVPHPDIITESGRALVSHSGVLVFEVLGSRVFPVKPDRKLVERAAGGGARGGDAPAAAGPGRRVRAPGRPGGTRRRSTTTPSTPWARP
jgi:arginine decarboxylase-like protein